MNQQNLVDKQQFERQKQIVQQQLQNTKDLFIQDNTEIKIVNGSTWILQLQNNEEKTKFRAKRFFIQEEKQNKVSEQLLMVAKNEVMVLKECYDSKNPRTIKLVDQFLIVYNYYILMEMCPYDIKQFMNDPSLQLEQGFKLYQLINVAYQIIQGLCFVNQKNHTLKNRQIESILVDNLNQIKLSDLQKVENFINEINEKPEGLDFYYPPECGKESISIENFKSFNVDSWTFGMYIYILAGGSDTDCMQVKESGYKHSQSIDKNLNDLLSKILCLNSQQRLPIELIKTELEKLLDYYVKKSEQFSEQIYERFQEYKKQKHYKLAYRYITLCTQMQKANEKYLYEQGFIQDELQLYEESIQSFQRCIELKEKNLKKDQQNEDLDNYYYNLAIVQKNQNLIEDAIKSYLKAISFNPNKPSYHYNLGIAYVESGDQQKGIKSFTTCLELDKEQGNYKYNCLYNIGCAFSEKGQWDKAIKEYQKLIKISEESQIKADAKIISESYYNMGNAYYEKRQYKRAIENYDLAIKTVPNNYYYQNNNQNPSYYYNFGMAYLVNKQFDEALAQFQQCESIIQKDIQHPVYEQLAICYKKKNELNYAIQQYQKCVQLYPKEYSYLVDLGDAYCLNKEYENAINQYDRYLNINKNDRRVLRKKQNADNKKNNKKFCFFW
ncbi:hypothetical protein ABPG74_018427 [Tetrahymena malaccensis]